MAHKCDCDKCPNTSDCPPGEERAVEAPASAGWRGLGVGLLIAALVGIGVYAAMQSKPGGPTSESTYSVAAFRKTDPALFLCTETGSFATGMRNAVCVAAGAQGRIYVGGDSAVWVFEADGKRSGAIQLPANPTCLAYASDGTLFIGTESGVLTAAGNGPARALLELPPPSLILGIAVTPERLFVADAGKAVVRMYGRDGKEAGKLGAKTSSDDGLVIYRPCLSVAVGQDELVRVVDPGRHRLKLYKQDGTLVSAWKSQSSMKIEGFTSCCNPAHIVLLPDGRVVTSEKGLPRVKVYAGDGQFQGVVVGADGFKGEAVSPGIAVDERGRIVVLDPFAATVRVFEFKERPRS
jgi:hypothetical protein